MPALELKSNERTVLNLLDNLRIKLDKDERLNERTAQVCQSCVHSMQYILTPVPHRKISPDFQPENNYCEYLKHLSKSIRRNRNLSNTDYQNLILLIQTLQTELWQYK